MSPDTAADAAAAMAIHPAHHGRLEDLDQSMVNVLVWPELRFVNDSPFTGALIVPLFLFGF